MKCVTTTRMFVVCNGGPTKEFRLAKGIHQEDSLSLHLFLLCMDMRSHNINKQLKGISGNHALTNFVKTLVRR